MGASGQVHDYCLILHQQKEMVKECNKSQNNEALVCRGCLLVGNGWGVGSMTSTEAGVASEGGGKWPSS